MNRIIVFASFLIIALAQNNFAQIDTNDVYPIHKGNLWEYTNYIDTHYYEVIVGEETLPNGKTYKRRMSVNLVEDDLLWDTTYSYWRVENQKVYWYWANMDSKMYDCSLPVGSVWRRNSTVSIGRKIYMKLRYFDNMFGDTLSLFLMENVHIDTARNPPDTTVVMDIYDDFTKGVGRVNSNNGVRLTGAIINSKKYGNITVDVEYEKPILDNYRIEIDTYPNPFNGTCNVTFTIPKTQNIKLKLFNILGEEVYTLFSGNLQKGEQHFNLNMPKEISSGIFFILLETEKRNYSKKILYLK